MATLPQKFGKLVQERRLAAGMSQETLAHEAGLHRTFISFVERGLRVPTIITVQKLAKALGTTMATLMAELEAKE